MAEESIAIVPLGNDTYLRFSGNFDVKVISRKENIEQMKKFFAGKSIDEINYLLKESTSQFPGVTIECCAIERNNDIQEHD